MEKNKVFWGVLIVGALAGLAANILVLPFLVRINFLNTAVILDKIIKPKEIITKVEEKMVLVPRTEYFSEAVSKVKNSVVAVESFNQGQLIRSGSGIVMTRDGLIFTLNNIVPPESTATQIIDSGHAVSAKVVFRDSINNIAIIDVAESDFQVVRLKEDLPELTQNLAVISKSLDFDKDQILFNQAVVSEVNPDKKLFKISIPYDQNIYGSAIVENNGAVLGILDFKNFRPSIVLARQINIDLNTYLTKIQK